MSLIVGAAGAPPAVVIVSVQPPLMLPWSTAASSTTNNDQTPFADNPLNAENVVPYGPLGACAGNASVVPKLVGLKVPETIWALSGSAAAAPSDRVSDTLLTSFPPPASDRITTFCPVGDTSKISTSSG